MKPTYERAPSQHILSICLATLLISSTAYARPSLSSVYPRGVQRGTTVELTFNGSYIKDTLELVMHDPGIKPIKITPVNNNQIKATVQVSADCRLGEHRLRLRTNRGWSDARTVFVGALKVTREKEPNSTIEQAQAISMNTTVHGVVTAEDIDYYIIEAKKGQRITAEVEGIRLGVTLFDPHVTIMDAKRFELDAADDTALLQQDPVASAIAPADGKYFIVVRESAYGGSTACHYRLHVGSFPRPTAVYPAGGKKGEKLNVQFLGDKAGVIKAEVQLPKETSTRHGLFASTGKEISPSPNWIRVSDFGNFLEKEPNDSPRAPNKYEAAPPIAFNGIIQKDKDADWFSFMAKKGRRYQIRVFARSLRSKLDAVVHVYNHQIKYISGNDDSGTGNHDSRVDVTAPADGPIHFRIRDHLQKGGADYVYRVEVTPIRARLTLSIPHVRRYDSQSRQFASIPAGNRYLVYVSTRRENFGGNLKLWAEKLPTGVTMHVPIVKSNVSAVPVVFEAASDAKVAGTRAKLKAKLDDPKRAISGEFVQIVDLVRGNPNQTAYYSTTLRDFNVAVTQPAPFKVNIVEPKVPITRDGRMNIKVIATRTKGFDGPITLTLPFRPPGVSARSSVVIPKGKTVAYYPINANGGASIGEWQIAMLGSASVGGHTQHVSTQLAKLTIAPQFVTGSIPIAVTEQGQSVEVIVNLNHVTSFEGEATLQLYGLVHECKATPLKIKKGQKEAVFTVTTTKKSPPGQHRSMFCQFVLVQHGEQIVQSLAGGGVLRIDRPRPKIVAKKPVKKPVAKTPAKPKPKPKRRLTRLEQLRLEQKQRAAAKAAAAAGGSTAKKSE